MEAESQAQVQTIKGTLEIEGRKIQFPEITDIRNLNIFVGANGVGKTVIMKMIWFSNFALATYKILLMTDRQPDKTFRKAVKEIFKYTFWTSSNDFHCEVYLGGHEGTPYNFALKIKDGELIDLRFDYENEKDFINAGISIPLFNSKEARTFVNYEQFLTLMKRNNLKRITDFTDMPIFEGFFALYDVLWFENIRLRVQDIEAFNQKVEKHKDFFDMLFEGSKIERFEAHDDALYAVIDGKSVKLSKLSSGQQSMLMMTMFA